MRTFELAHWINERYAMKLRKELHVEGVQNVYGGPWKFGWSDDPHMGLVRYCNVHREDDKVTRWLAVNWRPEHHAVWEIVLARMLNYIPTLEELLADWPHFAGGWGDLQGATNILKRLRERGKIFSSAYTISTCGKSMDKIDYVVDHVVAAVKERGEFWEDPLMLEKCHRQLCQIDGLGSFLAAQVVADLKNTAGHPLQAARDWWTWAAPGPGSLRGLTALYGRPITPGEFRPAIIEAWMAMEGKLNRDIPRIGMQDFQNCLCEFSKYIRVKEGGHVRNRYPSR